MQVVVAAFQAPAPPTQVAFFFHSTEVLNPCMWATDLDLQQTAYPAPDCNGCNGVSALVRQSFNIINTEDGPQCKVDMEARTYFFQTHRKLQGFCSDHSH